MVIYFDTFDQMYDEIQSIQQAGTALIISTEYEISIGKWALEIGAIN